MKVLHLINTLSAGGAELHLLTLCRCLKRLGVETTIAYLKEVKISRSLRSDFEVAGIPVFYLKGDSTGLIYSWFQLHQLFRQQKPDILHTHLPRADLLGFLSCLSGFSGTWVCSVHGIYANHWRGRWTLPLFGWIWRKADQTVAISEAVKNWLVRNYRLPYKKIQVVYYGIELERWVSPTQNLRKTWELIGKPFIGTVGRLEPRKGHDVLIQAMPLIVRQFPQAMLLIAGHDPWGYRRVLERLAIQLGMESHVRLLGFQGDIPSFLHAVDVFAFASRSEGFGQVVIEAMAAGRPVVVSRIAPLTEIVVDGETGFWAEPESPKDFAEKILWLLSHPHEVRHMVEKAQQRVRECFSAEVMANKTLDIYRKVRQ